jgi:hypothetical protein
LPKDVVSSTRRTRLERDLLGDEWPPEVARLINSRKGLQFVRGKPTRIASGDL